MADFFIFIPFITFTSVLFILAYVLGQRKRSVVNNSFVLFTFFMMLAPLLDFLIHIAPQQYTKLLYQILIPILLSLGFLFLNFVFTLINKKRNILYWLCLIGGILSVFAVYFFPPLSMVIFPGYNVPLPVPTIWFLLPFVLSDLIFPTYAIILCILHVRTEKNIVLYRQLRLVVSGALISTPFTLFAVFIGPLLLNNYSYLRFATLTILINTIFMFRAVQRHFLLSVNIEQIENAFNRLFENSHDAVILLDSGGIAIQVNNSTKKLFGFKATSITKEYLEKHISGYDFAINGTDFSATIKGDNDIKYFQLSQSLVKSNDVSLGKLLIIRDVSLQKKNEQLLLDKKHIESIGMLAGGIAHDFNNLLCGIVSNLSLAKMDIEPSSKTAELLSLSETSALHARDLTQQLLTFSKGDNRKKEVFNIAELICDIGNFMSHSCSIQMTFELPKAPVFIDADKGQMRQVFQNLILNAIESMPNGGDLHIHGKTLLLPSNSSLQDRTNPFFEVSISDQGCGIAAENISRIFEPYFTTKPKGNGLGLAIVNSIISKCNGSISVSSQIGKGSVLTVCLPVATTVVQPSHSIHFENTPKQHGRILIMDDYSTVRLSLALLLQRMGYVVDQASSGNEAIDIYDKAVSGNGSYQAVITDLTVPGAMGGKSLAEELHKRNPDLPIIVSSGYSEEVAIARYREFGFAGVLHKPYSPEELHDVLESVLSAA